MTNKKLQSKFRNLLNGKPVKYTLKKLIDLKKDLFRIKKQKMFIKFKKSKINLNLKTLKKHQKIKLKKNKIKNWFFFSKYFHLIRKNLLFFQQTANHNYLKKIEFASIKINQYLKLNNNASNIALYLKKKLKRRLNYFVKNKKKNKKVLCKKQSLYNLMFLKKKFKLFKLKLIFLYFLKKQKNLNDVSISKFNFLKKNTKQNFKRFKIKMISRKKLFSFILNETFFLNTLGFKKSVLENPYYKHSLNFIKKDRFDNLKKRLKNFSVLKKQMENQIKTKKSVLKFKNKQSEYSKWKNKNFFLNSVKESVKINKLEKNLKKIDYCKKLYYELEESLEILSASMFDITQGTFNYDFIPEKNREQLLFYEMTRQYMSEKQSNALNLIIDLTKENENLNSKNKISTCFFNSMIQKNIFYSKKKNI